MIVRLEVLLVKESSFIGLKRLANPEIDRRFVRDGTNITGIGLAAGLF